MIRLNKFDKAFYADLISLIESEEELMQFAGPAFTFPLTDEQLDKSLSDKNRFAFVIKDEETNPPVGHAEIYLTEQSALLSRILISDVKQRGKGLGQQIVHLLLDFTFTNFEQEKAELNVFDWNIAAIKCYEKVGFVINPGQKLERKIKDTVWTAINMTIDKIKWQQSGVNQIKKNLKINRTANE